MKYLIDTHIFLWLLFEPNKLPLTVLKQLKSNECELYICSISFWEISLKFNLGKLLLEGVTPDELLAYAQQMHITVVDFTADNMASHYQLPKPIGHKDPFDRAIIWKCLSDDFILVSRDQKMDEYVDVGLKLLNFNT